MDTPKRCRKKDNDLKKNKFGLFRMISEVCPTEMLTRCLHQKLQTSSSTGAIRRESKAIGKMQ